MFWSSRRDEEYIWKVVPSTYSFSITELGRTSGSNVGYTNVTESILSKETFEREESTFSFPAQFGVKNDISRHLFPYGECYGNICEGLYTQTRVYNFFMYGNDARQVNLEYFPTNSLSHLTPPNPNYDWNRGLLLKKETYTEGDNLVKKEDYVYKNYFANGSNSPSEVYGLKISEFDVKTNFEKFEGDITSNYAYRVAKYKIYTDVSKVLTKKKTTYYYGGKGFLSYQTDYKYNRKGLLYEEKNINSRNKKESKNYTYVSDLLKPWFQPANNPPHVKAIQIMNIKNMIDYPVEVISRVDGVVSGAKLYNYVFFDKGGVNLSSIESLKKGYISPFTKADFVDNSFVFIKDKNYHKNIIYHAYDNKGNPTEVSKADGTHIVYIWGYQQTQPIAKIENAKLSDISEATITNLQTLSNQDNDRTIRNIGKEGALRAALNTLRTSLSNAQVTTFTYDPLIGVTSITDPRGQTIYYEYDDFNRLEFVKDADGNLLKEHKYKYKN